MLRSPLVPMAGFAAETSGVAFDWKPKTGSEKKGSGRWGCRPLVGMGVMEVQRLEVPADGPAAPKVALQSLSQGAARSPESTTIVRGRVCTVDRPLGSIISGTKVPLAVFA